jgi:hypothetical protein
MFSHMYQKLSRFTFSHMDQAAEYLAQTRDYPPMSVDAEKRLLRKMDWILIPMVRFTLITSIMTERKEKRYLTSLAPLYIL